MESGPASHPSGQHLLGPHVVGRRVVVRRLVPGETGPTGGPALTDLLGTCLSWSSTECVVAPEDGPPVHIPLSLIVSGKPVPPRPSARARVSPAEAESHVADLWPHIEQVPLGGWTLRSEPAGRLRANSCLAMADPGMPYADASARVRSFYAARGREPMVQVEQDSDVERALRDLGWEPLGSDDFLLASLAQVRRRLRSADVSVAVSVDGDVATVAARGRAAYGRDWLGIHDVEPAQLAVLAALLEWGAERGATTVWLHVEDARALAFYDSLGFVAHHTATYLRWP